MRWGKCRLGKRTGPDRDEGTLQKQRSGGGAATEAEPCGNLSCSSRARTARGDWPPSGRPRGRGGTAPPSSEPRLSRGTGRTQELGWRPGGGGGEAEHKGAPWRSVVKAETGGLAVCVGTFTGHTKS